MDANQQMRVAALYEKKLRLERAVATLRENGDISRVLEADEFQEVMQVVNTAAAGKVSAMLSETVRRIESEVGQ